MSTFTFTLGFIEGQIRSWLECVICSKKVAEASMKEGFRNIKGQLFREKELEIFKRSADIKTRVGEEVR